MPPGPKRRNRAYLNRLGCRVRALGRVAGDYLAATPTGLAICLDGSLEQRFRSSDVRVIHLDGPLPLRRREDER